MKNLFLSAAILASMVFVGCGSGEEKKQNDGAVPHDSSAGVSVMNHDTVQSASLAFICPCGGCPEVRESKAGKCPKCGIDLVQEKK